MSEKRKKAFVEALWAAYAVSSCMLDVEDRGAVWRAYRLLDSGCSVALAMEELRRIERGSSERMRPYASTLRAAGQVFVAVTGFLFGSEPTERQSPMVGLDCSSCGRCQHPNEPCPRTSRGDWVCSECGGAMHQNGEGGL